MNTDVDYYDVQAMIRDATSDLRAEVERTVRDRTVTLWRDVNRELEALREEIRQLREET